MALDQMIGGLTGDMAALNEDINKVRSELENLDPEADEDLIEGTERSVNRI